MGMTASSRAGRLRYNEELIAYPLVGHSTTIRLRSLAKINLDLRVLNKRPDGFHNLRTIFQTVSLADTIEIDYTPSRRLSVELRSSIEIPGNLIEKAAELLAIPGRFQIRLTKRIPMGGGLGGGSSNAATILLAIPALTGRRIPLEKLVDIASQIGSDVPFFLLGGTALGQGRGTELYPIPDLRPYPAILITPGLHVSTAAAYQALNRPNSELRAQDAAASAMKTENPAPPRRVVREVMERTANSDLLWTLETSPPRNWAVANDFEEVVFRQHPRLKLVKGTLQKSGAGLALMSGSGSTLFGIFEHRAGRDSALVSLRKDLGKEGIFPVALVGRRRYRTLWRRQLRVSTDVSIWPPQNRYA
jgi:4-diphosphocytidyl-2-C-methyl-D-erythritol kinase